MDGILPTKRQYPVQMVNWQVHDRLSRFIVVQVVLSPRFRAIAPSKIILTVCGQRRRDTAYIQNHHIAKLDR